MSNPTEQVDTNESLQKLFEETLSGKTSPEIPAVASTETTVTPTEQPAEQPSTPEVDKPNPDATENQWKASLPDEARKYLESLEQNNRALHNNWKMEQGRTAKALREQQEYRQKLEQASKRQEQTPVATTPNDKVSALLEALKESDPAMHELLLGIKEEAVSKAKQEQEVRLNELVDSQIKPMRVAKEEDYAAQQMSILNRECPNWAQVMQAPEFVDYMRHQPTRVQELYLSIHADDVLYLLRNYERDVFGTAQEAPQKGGDPKASEAAQVQARRENKLQTSVVPANGSTNTTRVQQSEEEILRKLFEDELKRR